MKTTNVLLICLTAVVIAVLKYSTAIATELTREQFVLTLAQGAAGVHVRPGANKLEHLSYTGPNLTGLPPLPTQNPDPDSPPTE